jgi:CHAT domain-containing protein
MLFNKSQTVLLKNSTFFLCLVCSGLAAQVTEVKEDSIRIMLEQYENAYRNAGVNKKELTQLHLEQILEKACEINYNNDSIFYHIHTKLLSIYFDLNNHTQAKYHINAAIAAANRFYGESSMEAIFNLDRLALVQELLYDNYSAALTTREKIIALEEKFDFYIIPPDNQARLIENRLRIASIYALIGSIEKANSLLRQANQLRTACINKYSNRDRFSLDLFASYTALLIGEEDQAEQIISYQNNLLDSIFQTNKSQSINQLFFAKVLLAEVYLAQEKYNLACQLSLEADKLLMTYSPGVMSYEAYGKFILGKALLKAKRYEESEAVLEAFTTKFNNFSQRQYESTNFVNLAQLNELLARCYHEQYLLRGDQNKLSAATLSIQQAQAALQNAWHNFNNQDDLRYNLKEYYEIFETAFYIQHSLFQATHNTKHLYESLRLMERSRNVALRTSLRRRTVAEKMDIPAHLLDKEQRLRKKIFELEYQLAQIEGVDTVQLQKQLHKQKEELIVLNEEINELSPDFTRAMHENSMPSVRDLDTYLEQQQQTIVYYISGEEGLYLIGLSPRGQVFQRIPIEQDSLRNLIDQLRNTLYNNPGQPATNDLRQLANTSRRLYQLLLAPIENITTDRLVIIPDGPLEIIPFSLLLSKDVNIDDIPLKSWPFAIKDYSFSYAYSLELLLRKQEQQASHVKEKILAFAPNFQAGMLRGDSSRFQGELKSNQDEVAFIDDLFSCQAYYEDAALLSVFRKEAPNYSVLHLATHASANIQIGDYSFLAFSEAEQYDHRLEVGELYGMHIPAELVVLSACETGLGEWQRGEGVIGLERAFSYAGAKSLITTHWKVSDRASAKLMSQLYDQLATGLPKDIALQQAQLAYMNSSENWLSHPFFWAGFVQKGNTSPLNIPRRKSGWPWILGGILVISGFGYRKIRQQKVA